MLEEVEHWYFGPESDDVNAVTGAIDLLEQEGPTLGRPAVDRVKGSKFHGRKELRPPGMSIRILFIFDLRRQAILLLGAGKAGKWKTCTTGTFRSPNGGTRTGSKEVNDDDTQLA